MLISVSRRDPHVFQVQIAVRGPSNPLPACPYEVSTGRAVWAVLNESIDLMGVVSCFEVAWHYNCMVHHCVKST
jgi:hypothetical protein